MKWKSLLFLCAMAFGLVSMSDMANATDTKTALAMCAKNPACSVFRSAGGGRYEITVGGGGGNSIITCPAEMTGQCECVECLPPQRSQPLDIGKILATDKVKTPPERSGGDKDKPSREKPEKTKDEAPAGGGGGPIL